MDGRDSSDEDTLIVGMFARLAIAIAVGRTPEPSSVATATSTNVLVGTRGLAGGDGIGVVAVFSHNSFQVESRSSLSSSSVDMLRMTSTMAWIDAER